MLLMVLFCSYLAGFSLILALFGRPTEARPTLSGLQGLGSLGPKEKFSLFRVIRKLAVINKPLVAGPIRTRMVRDLAIAHVNATPEEFMLIKEIGIFLFLFFTFPVVSTNLLFGWICLAFILGYMLPEIWVKGKIKKVKHVIVKELPDAVDLLALCVNAGLDFMLAMKWVVEKSPPSVMIEELNTVLQEINVGKTRRAAIKDLAARFELPDLSTFARTLIQADKMGTSMTEALNILSEDMRLARYRRGEQMALKAPLKLLVPLLLFIFPVVGVLVAGPIMLDFIQNNPFSSLAGK